MDALKIVEKAARRKDEAGEEYRQALIAAAKTYDYAAIAKAAGTSRQNIRQLLLRKGQR